MNRKEYEERIAKIERELDELKEIAKKYRLSLSAFLRLAAAKYVEDSRGNSNGK